MDNYIEQGQLNRTLDAYRSRSFEIKTESVKTEIISHRQPPTAANPAFTALPEHQFFNEKTSEVFLKFAPYLEKVSFAGSDFIYQPGDEIDYVYFPQSSIFSEFQILEDGATVEIAMTGSEGIVGLAAIFDQSAATNWTQISAAGNALRIKSKILRQEANDNPDLQRFLYACVGAYIKQISQRSACNNCHSLEKRLCSWLLMMQDRLENPKLPLTQEQMAGILGANRPSVTNIAHNLRVAGIIDYRRGVLVIRDRAELENRACGCYAEMSYRRHSEVCGVCIEPDKQTG